MRVFITRKLDPAVVRQLIENGIEVTEWTEKRDLNPRELSEYCSRSDGLISVGGNKLDSHFLSENTHLRFIALHAVGYDNVDVPAATRLGIPVGNTPGVVSRATADTAFLLMLAVSRKAFFHHKRILRGDWTFFDPGANLGIELDGKTLGIFGLGNIGLQFARRARAAFGMEIIYHNRGRNEKAELELEARKVSFEDLLAQSDVLSVHASLNEENTGIFNGQAFERMKRSAIFINTSRGKLHDEADLVTALQAQQIWGAGLDVTNPEPMDPNHLLLQMDNVCITPHIGTSTRETRAEMARLIVENALAASRGEKLPYIVNPEVYEQKHS
ncbi:2-hydroxyacid dehydrogenase [Arcticibacter sp. MXS-1]|uniref:2-hydroxyacid dehydrogenase n=1 Tax=Arcticibacter sp. MXS-1 TaxID=3341726 RepID=UPI0035A83526